MRIFALCLVAAAAVPALASYELMLLPDINTNRVTRFDPVNNVALGSFGPFVGTSTAYVNYRGNGDTYVTSPAGTTAYNTSSGIPVLQGAFPNNKASISPQGNRLLEVSGTILYRTDANTLSQSGFSLSSATAIEQVVPFSDNLWGIVHRTIANPAQFVIQTYDANANTLGTVVNLGTNFTPGSFGFGQTFVNSAGVSIYRCTARNSSGTLILATFSSVSGTTWGFGTNNPVSFSNYGASASVAILPAHQGYYAVGDDAANANNTRFTYLNANNHVALSSSVSTSINVPTTNWSASVIVAPEPGSAAMLALGAFSLLARRRRHR